MEDSEGDQEGVFHLSHPILGERAPQRARFQEGFINNRDLLALYDGAVWHPTFSPIEQDMFWRRTHLCRDGDGQDVTGPSVSHVR
jgi:hypothetical protein